MIVLELGWDGVVVMCFDGLDEEDTYRPAVDLAMRFVPKYPRWKFTLCELSALEEKHKEALLADKSAEAIEPFVAVRHGSKKRYVLEGSFEKMDGGLKDFLSQAHAGKLFSRYRSGPKHANEVQEGVTLLTGHTFDEHTKNPKLDYFVFFTHGRCDHCRDLQPVWKKLAAEVKAKGWRKQGVIIAAMDAEKNDCEEDIQEYPRLVLYPAVKAEQKMKKKRLFSPDHVQSLASLPVSRLLDFLSGNAVNLEGVEEESLEAEIAKSKVNRQQKKGKKHQEL